MSRTKLKKELSQLTKEEIIEVVCDAYASHPGVKQYFSFYLNPDVKALTEKYSKMIRQEFSRSKRHECKCRISHVKKMLKEYDSYGVGTISSINMRLYVLGLALEHCQYVLVGETLMNGVVSVFVETMQKANEGLIYAEVRERVMQDFLTSPYFARYTLCFRMRNALKNLEESGGLS